jgi:predicted dehydrogenase
MKAVLIGGNGFGSIHADSYRRLRIPFSVFDRNPAVLESYRRDFGVIDAYQNLDEALNSDAEMVDIVLPHNMHRDVSIKAMRAGKHVLIEKPIATSLQDAREMLEEARRNHVKLMVAEQYYFDQSIATAKQLVRQNKIGDIHSVIVREQRSHNKPGWRNNINIMGGGALIDGGIHLIDVLLDICGGYEEICSTTYRGGSPLEGEDSVMATFKFRQGLSGFLFYSWAYPFAPSLPSYEIVGSEGSIVEDTGTRPGDRFNSGKGVRYVFGMPVLNGKKVDVKVNDVFDSEISGFARSIEKNADPPYPIENAMRNLEAVMRIYNRN